MVALKIQKDNSTATFLAIFDDDKKRSLSDKVHIAIAMYQDKFHTPATVVQSRDEAIKDVIIDGITMEVESTIQENMVYVGQKES